MQLRILLFLYLNHNVQVVIHYGAQIFFLHTLLNTMCPSHPVFMSLLCPTQINNFAFVGVKIHLLGFCLMLQLIITVLMLAISSSSLYFVLSAELIIIFSDSSFIQVLEALILPLMFPFSLRQGIECTLIEYGCASNSISI